jgi:multidrug resistance efflux pump
VKTITLTILLLMIASPLLASEVVVWKNGRAITFNVNRDGDVVTISPDQSGSIVGNVNNSNLSELRQPDTASLFFRKWQYLKDIASRGWFHLGTVFSF